ncbi:complement decay-accelerating factor isoform X3 [Nannospalax galili]|uniref:complement decay-accelerating factor isoform X3 n=1 Tax=Nannospalax galili TaxID=1026970 RepID=UPI00111C0920|nr:complement decay-accelerating factor isoform X3 [Nannospalax galili]
MSRRRLPRGQLLLLLALLCPPVRGDCNLPPEVRNAQPDLNGSTSFPEQSFVTYKCDEGFLKIPDKVDTVTCLENGQWSDIEEFCGRSCNVPTRLVFASLKKEYITKNFYPVGFTVEYECRPGFQRTSFSSGKSTCLQNLEWSEVDTFCKKKSCPNPGDIQNGNINITTDMLFGSQIFFSCNTGYKLLGADSSFCSVVGKTVAWSDPLPTCTEIFCPEPPEIDNGIIKGESENYVYGQSISYECDRGFILVGKSSIYCTVKNNDGEWNDMPPECKEKSLTSKVPPTVHKHTTVNFPSTEVPLMSQNPTTINVPATKIPSASQKPSTVHAPATQHVPVTRPAKKFHSTRTSTTQKEISTSDADDLIYGHTCVITLTVLLVMLVIIG